MRSLCVSIFFVLIINCMSAPSSERRNIRPCVQVFCFADPCMMSQCSVTGATCESDYCNGCNAVWTVNERKLSSSECTKGHVVVAQTINAVS